MIFTQTISEFHMVATFFFIATVIILYVWEKLPIELSSALCLSAMITLFHLMPLNGPNGTNLLDAQTLLSGFANPALITVLCLIMVGQGLVNTGALSHVASLFGRLSHHHAGLTVILILTGVAFVAAFLNNTPVVVIFIPILHALAQNATGGPRRFLMPLSFASILGGMTTLIGSSTNLLVSRSLTELGLEQLHFFEFTALGAFLAAIGMIYVLFLLPWLLGRQSPSVNASEPDGDGKQFLAQVKLREGSPLIGTRPVAGLFRELPDVTVLTLWRGQESLHPPFDDLPLEFGDTLLIAATRDVLTDSWIQQFGLVTADKEQAVTGGKPPALNADPDNPPSHRQVVEAMVTPGSRLVGSTIRRVNFMRQYGSMVLGLKRRAHMIRNRITEIPLRIGDTMLIYGTPGQISNLRHSQDMAVIQQSEEDLPTPYHAKRTLLIFVGMVLLAISEILPIVIAGLLAASLMILTGSLRLGAALRGIDFKLVFIIGTSLALGTALELSGGATFVAEKVIIEMFSETGPAVLLSAYFLIVMIFTNLISNNACAVLFTPIGVHIAWATGIDPHIFAIATLFAANCSFCSPIGYQTNLLVMGPGRYAFGDFLRLGTPLALLIWLVYSLVAPVYYGL